LAARAKAAQFELHEYSGDRDALRLWRPLSPV
jgi:hypothetical protein